MKVNFSFWFQTIVMCSKCMQVLPMNEENSESPQKSKFPTIDWFLLGNTRYDLSSDIPRTIYAPGYSVSGIYDKDIASNFLFHRQEMLDMLQIDSLSKDDSFNIRSVRTAGVWKTIRYLQMHKNIQVYNVEISVTLNQKNEIRMVTSTYKKGIALKRVIPKLSPNDIKQRAAKKYGKGNVANLKFYEAKMVIYQTETGSSKLSWQTNLIAKDNISEMEIVIDDETGEILVEKDKTLDKKGQSNDGSYNEGREATFSINSKIRTNERRGQSSNDVFALLIELITSFSNWFLLLLEIINGGSTSSPTAFPTLQPSSFPTLEPSSSPSFNPSDGIGFVFDPDPLSTSSNSYCDEGLCDNNDADSNELTDQLSAVILKNITEIQGEYLLKGPYAQIFDFEEPFKGEFAQRSNDFRYTRGQDEFEAVNCYYHLDNFLRYINEDLNIKTFPIQYDGGLKYDPHASNGEDNSYYSTFLGVLGFGEGGVDDGEDADVIIHELGHAIHDWVTDGSLSNREGLSEGFGDYLTSSYARYKGLRSIDEPEYNWVFKWDGHNEFWPGRKTNFEESYPDGLSDSIHESGQIWSTCSMRIWDLLGRIKSDQAHIIALSALGLSSNQQDAAQAIYLAAHDLGYSEEEISSMKDILNDCGYQVTGDICGDGILGDSEECDGELIRNTCESSTGCTVGTPICNSFCKSDLSTCSAGINQTNFRLDLTLDIYVDETTWTLTDSSGSTIRFGEYENAFQMEQIEYACIEKDECYLFEIFDLFGDGICCSFGNGTYDIFIDSVPLNNTNGSFGARAEHYIGPCDDIGNFTCSDSQAIFQVDIYFDLFALETAWSVIADSNDTLIYAGGFLHEYEFLGLSNISEFGCLEKDECYRFEILDSMGDGLCCVGGEGGYDVFVDSVPLNNTDSSFGSNATHFIGPCNITE